MSRMYRFSSLLLTIVFLAACSGGGGGGGSPAPDPNPNPPPVNNNPPPSNDDKDPMPGPDPEPDEEEDNDSEPLSPVDVYKASIGNMLGTLVLMEKLGKSEVYTIPQLVADQITAHGPSRDCDLQACEPDYTEPSYPVYLPTGEEVTWHFWGDWNGNLVFDVDLEATAFSVTDIYGITGSVMVMYKLQDGRPMYNMGIGARYDAEIQEGMLVGTTKTLRVSGMIMVREIADGRLRIGDFDIVPSATRNIALIETTPAGERLRLLETVFTMDTNKANSDSIDAKFDWVPYGGGAAESFETLEPLDFGEINLNLVLEAGSFLYTREEEDGTKVAVRVSVGADPAYLYLEIDEGADGTYESSDWLAQADVPFVLP